MFFYMAMGAGGLKIFERIIPHLATFDLVVDLKVFQRPAPLTPLLFSSHHSFHQKPLLLQGFSFKRMNPEHRLLRLA